MDQHDLFAQHAPSAPPAAPFFNTCELAGAPLTLVRRQAGEQCQRVLAIFRARPSAQLGPSQVWKLGDTPEQPWLLTSVRRAMTTLSAGDAPALRKLLEMRDGPYGKPEHLWAEVQP